MAEVKISPDGRTRVHFVPSIVPLSRELWDDVQGLNADLGCYLSATDEERAAWAEEARLKRAAVRAEAERVELTLDALLDKLGFSREYAEHLVQPYCDCGDSADGWDSCAHARDEEVRS